MACVCCYRRLPNANGPGPPGSNKARQSRSILMWGGGWIQSECRGGWLAQAAERLSARRCARKSQGVCLVNARLQLKILAQFGSVKIAPADQRNMAGPGEIGPIKIGLGGNFIRNRKHRQGDSSKLGLGGCSLIGGYEYSYSYCYLYHRIYYSHEPSWHYGHVTIGYK